MSEAFAFDFGFIAPSPVSEVKRIPVRDPLAEAESKVAMLTDRCAALERTNDHLRGEVRDLSEALKERTARYKALHRDHEIMRSHNLAQHEALGRAADQIRELEETLAEAADTEDELTSLIHTFAEAGLAFMGALESVTARNAALVDLMGDDAKRAAEGLDKAALRLAERDEMLAAYARDVAFLRRRVVGLTQELEAARG